MQHQLRGLVQGVVETVAVGQPCRVEAAGAVADQVDDGAELVGHGPGRGGALAGAGSRIIAVARLSWPKFKHRMKKTPPCSTAPRWPCWSPPSQQDWACGPPMPGSASAPPRVRSCRH